MTNKELYREFCRNHSDIPIFMQDWWMDAVCAGKEWDALLVTDEQGETMAAMPYLIRKRAWFRYIIMPQMTQIGGVWLHEDLRDDTTKTATICQELSSQLAQLKLSYYYQHYPLQSTAVEAIEACGFKKRERITYRIEDLSDLDQVIARFSKNKKRQLQKALSLHASSMYPEDFYRFHSQCMSKQGKQITYSREFFLVLERKTSRHNQSHILSICNADNQVLAAALLVWDKHSMYYLIPCYDPKHKDSGAGALLVLEAIKLARQKGVAFDFEGSMIKGIANHYKQFGSTATKYYSLEKYYHWWFWFANAYNWLRERKMR
jgi:CelD/BcsL family acetyltransferase involved in cellulose biosynthesis